MGRTKKLTAGAMLGGAFLLMGLSMPSCPGQQEMQKQVSDLTAKQVDAQKALSTHSEKVKSLESEVGNLKTTLQEVAEVLKSHKTTIEGLQAKIDEMGKGGAKKPAKRR